jgi:hypothetical protein
MHPTKRTARIAGLFYLVVAVCGGFAQFFARGTVYVRGDAAATVDNIVRDATLFRLGFVADLVTATAFIFVGFLFFRLFKDINREVAAALTVFVAIGMGVMLLNLLNHFAALLVATDPSFAPALGADGADALAMLLLELHQAGYTIAGILFGLWLLPLGYLAYTSGLFPRALGVALVVACCAYLIDTLLVFLVPDLPEVVTTIVTAPAAIGELWMVGYLLIVGVRTRKPAAPLRMAVA